MDVATLLVVVMAVTQFVKKAVKSVFKVELGGKAAIIVSVLVSVGAVFVKAVESDTALGLGLVPVLIQVIIGSNMGYSLIKVARNK